MKKMFFVFAASVLTAATIPAQIFVGKSCDISFFSKTSVKDISAVNTEAKPIMDTKSKQVVVKVQIQGFKFESKLMQEHFNENYMESGKYPFATFNGKINEDVDLGKDGVYKVTVTGKLNIHNVEQERTLEGTIVVKGGEIALDTGFKVALKDHNIDRPSVVGQELAEVIDVKMKAVLVKK